MKTKRRCRMNQGKRSLLVAGIVSLVILGFGLLSISEGSAGELSREEMESLIGGQCVIRRICEAGAGRTCVKPLPTTCEYAEECYKCTSLVGPQKCKSSGTSIKKCFDETVLCLRYFSSYGCENGHCMSPFIRQGNCTEPMDRCHTSL